MGNNNMCINATAVNNNIVFAQCAGQSMQWRFIPYQGGYIIINYGNIVVDNRGKVNANGNPIIGFSQNNGSNQIWVPVMVNASIFLLKNPATNKCLTLNGSNFVIWDCTAANQNQWFHLGTPSNTNNYTFTLPEYQVVTGPIPTFTPY